MLRVLGGLATALLVTAGLVADVTPARAVTIDPLPACTDGGPRPCVVSATRNGAPLPEDYQIQGRVVARNGARLVDLWAHHDAYDLGASDVGATWSVTVDLGDVAPRVVTGKAADVTVTRSGDSSLVTVTGTPVGVSGQCRRAVTPWRCPEYKPVRDSDNRDRAAIFRVTITDAADWAWADGAQAESATGLSVFDNLAASEPPVIIRDRTTRSKFLRTPVGSHRFLEDGRTLVDGRLQVRLPYPLLRSLYRISDPASMTSRGLTVTGAGAAARTTVTNDPGSETVVVDVTRIRFQKGGQVRRIGIRRGVLTPTRPVIRNIDRCCDHRFTVIYEMATPRGGTLEAHEIRCVPVVKGPAVSRVVSVDSFRPDRYKFSGLRLEPYDCRVRALSDAGASRWGPVVRSP